tara:strand:- start:545 stop:805 length:261 start_codon:yes stop_codon:yes gene_type:complete
VNKKKSVLRLCIACREIFDRDYLLKITRDFSSGMIINGGYGRSAYICKTQRCLTDPKLKKKLQKSLRTSFDQKFYEFFQMESKNYK